MNNRQAALIAAASAVSHTPKGGLAITWNQHVNRITENAEVLKDWLDEQDAAEAEGRAPKSSQELQQERDDRRVYGIR
ncbi:hypothetical protein Q7F20_07635 [Curtobacterium sp. A7_M15]|uniref:hypothetical protein n=1 Tax=Curtobacterium sp. A7_M15 TaxID=3065241 RepID=UPI002737CE2A|nr:hypothetical protein [Curtobacterium sp. A7_M15]MDP4333240.1 hypothetical protein [Curtobacterium sp. A7_M15]